MANNMYGGSTSDFELYSEPKGFKVDEYEWPKDGVTYTITNGVTYTIAKAPEPVGYWVLGFGGTYTTTFAMYSKPTADQIYNTEMLLGWKWKDA